MKHVIMYSSGIGSWATAKRVIDQHGAANTILLFCDVAGQTCTCTHHYNQHINGRGPCDTYCGCTSYTPEPYLGEDTDNYRFLQQSADKLGAELVWLKSEESIWDVYKRVRFLGNSRLAPCSHELKQKPARKWIEANCTPDNTILYVGIDWMESHRMPAVERNYLPYIVKAPLIDPPYMDKDEMLAACRDWGVEPPRMYNMKFPHANCGGFCVRAGQAQFRQLLRLDRDRYLFHEAKEQELRAHLDKDVSVLKDRSGDTATPLTLRTFRERIEEQPSLFDEEDWGGCGCFVDQEAAL